MFVAVPEEKLKYGELLTDPLTVRSLFPCQTLIACPEASEDCNIILVAVLSAAA
jgi:hypothetical protein